MGKKSKVSTAPVPKAKPEAAFWWLLAILLISTVWVYWGVWGYDYINFDDHEYVYENPHVLAGLRWEGVKWALTAGHAANWHPLTWISHMADVSLWGQRAGGAHVTNLLLHLLNTGLLFALVRKWTGKLWVAAWVAGLFAWHPLHVESVAWVSERKDVLSAWFGLLTLWYYTRWVKEGRRTVHYILAWACFAAGLMSKPMLVTLPCVLLLVDVWPLGRVRSAEYGVRNARDFVVEKIPFFALSAASSLVTLLVQQTAMQTMTNFPMGVRLGNAVVSYARYLGKTFWPDGLCVPYPHPGQWPVSLVLLSVALMFAVSVWGWMVRKERPQVLVGWLWFVGMLVPVIGLVQVGAQALADRYMYLPLVGLSLLVGTEAVRWAGQNAGWRNFLAGIGILSLAACALAAHRQAEFWQNGGTLSAHAVSLYPENDVALSNLGGYQLSHGQTDEAMRNLEAAIRTLGGSAKVSPSNYVAQVALDPEGPIAAELAKSKADSRKANTIAEFINNMGTALARKGRMNEAILHYRAALRLNPDHALALHNLAFEYAEQKNFAEAMPLFERAVRLRPEQSGIRCTYASALWAVGRMDDALAQYLKAEQNSPGDAYVRDGRGLALLLAGHTDEALAEFQKALALDPNLAEAHRHLAEALLAKGNPAEAVGHLEFYLKTPTPGRAGDVVKAQGSLGIALAMLGKIPEAEAHLREALRLDPDYFNAHFNLANTLAAQQRFGEAVAEYELFLKAVPDHAGARCNLGGALAELGRRAEAAQQFREALRLEPGNPVAAEQLRRLGESVNN